MIQNEKDFADWLDQQLNEDISDLVIAFNINLYRSPFNIEIVGSNEFDPEDEDWACREYWVPEQRAVFVSDALFGNTWEEAQENIIAMAKTYLKSESRNVFKLKSSKAFAVGFVDGNLSYIQ